MERMADQPIFVRGHLSPRGVAAFQGLLAFLFRLLTHVEVRGLEHLPPSGGIILSPNHLSLLDAPLILSLLRGRKTTVFAADTYRHRAFFRWIVEGLDTIWVQRGAIPPSTLKYTMQALRAGNVIGIAPEGTRSPTHTLQKGKSGAVFLASSTGVPVVPVALTNLHNVARELRHFRRARVTVTFGEPMYIPPLNRHDREAKMEELTTEVMCRIAALLPEEYRGAYAEEARVRELLSVKQPQGSGGAEGE